MTIPLGRPLPNASRGLPGRRAESGPFIIPIWPCSWRGLPCRLRYRSRGALLPHRFTLTARSRRSDLCGAFPGVAPAGRYPAPCFRGARTFLEHLRVRGHPILWPKRLVRPLRRRRQADLADPPISLAFRRQQSRRNASGESDAETPTRQSEIAHRTHPAFRCHNHSGRGLAASG